MSANATEVTPSPEAIAGRRAAHERELMARRRWRIAVTGASLSLLASYLCLLYWVRVMEPFYLFVNLLAITTALCNVIVYRVYELPTILAELQRPDWPKIGRACAIAWAILVSIALLGIATYRPEHGVSLIDRLQGKQAPIERHWSPLQ